MKIERALDWNQVSIDLSSQMNGIGYNPDLHRMHKNIDKMVTELSKLDDENLNLIQLTLENAVISTFYITNKVEARIINSERFFIPKI